MRKGNGYDLVINNATILWRSLGRRGADLEGLWEPPSLVMEVATSRLAEM